MQQEFTMLYEKYKNTIFGYLYYMTSDYNLAEDLGQEVFLKIYLNIGKFKGNSSFKTWALTIARNTFLTAASKKLVQFVELTEDMPTGEVQDHIENIIFKGEEIRLIQEVFKRLPEHYRTIILLRDREDMSYDQIGKIMDLPVSGVKITLHRARSRFRDVYKRLGGAKYGV